LDPNMIQTTEGPRDGVGAKLVWKGNDKVGSGTQVITGSTADQSVASDLDFGDMGAAKSVMTLTPDGNATRVTWTVDVDMGANPIGHYIGLTMDGMLGKDFALGLRKLKTLVESMSNTDIAGFSAEPVQLTAAPILVVSKTAPLEGISKAYGDGYAQIAKFMAKNKLHQAGAPLGIDGEMAAGSYKFDAGIPVDRGDAVSADGVRQFKATRVTRSKRRMWVRMTACRELMISCWRSLRCTGLRRKDRCSRGTLMIPATRRWKSCERRCTHRLTDKTPLG
jgi:Polyketide cyclase / dehydrase and lipid transport